MSYRQNPNLGDEIKNIMNDALNSNNFSKLNQDIGRTVNDALHDFESIFTGKPRYKEPDILRKPLAKETPNHKTGNVNTEKYKENFKENYNRPNKTYNANYATQRTTRSIPGNVAGILFTVFGFIGVGIFGLSLAGSFLAATLTDLNMNLVVVLATNLPFFAISGVIAAKGTQLRKRVKRFKRYQYILNGRKYCNLSEFAEPTGKTVKWIANDLQKMIYSGMFSFGRIDDEKSCIMLDNETYKQYIETKKWTKEQQEQQQEKNTNEAKRAASMENENEKQREQRITIQEGKNYIEQIRMANDKIPGEEVSQKLDRLESVTEKIFKHIEMHPEQIPEIRKFMNYYLPTTLKLTTAYAELDEHNLEGDNISSAKNEIRKTLDTINSAFENLLDDLFYHAAMDISSEISVLETMLAQEGLTEDELLAKKKKMEGKKGE